MNKKNKPSLKWMLGIAIILLALVYGTGQIARNIANSSWNSRSSSPKSFFQFLAGIFGIHSQYESILSNQLLSDENTTEGNISSSTKSGSQPGDMFPAAAGYVSPSTSPSGIASNTKATQGTGSFADQGPNSAQIESTTGNYAASNSESNAIEETGNVLEFNSEYNAEDNATNNAENNSELNAQNNAQNNAVYNAEENTGPLDSSASSNNNPGTNADQGPGNSSGNNNPYNNLGSVNLTNLPTINPIPSDAAASQSIDQQNNQRDTMAKLLADRQALVAPIQEAAQNSKYLPVAPISPPDPNAATIAPEILEQFKAHKITINH